LDIDLSDLDFDDESTNDDLTDAPSTLDPAQSLDNKLSRVSKDSEDGVGAKQLGSDIDNQLLASIDDLEAEYVSNLELRALIARRHLSEASADEPRDPVALAAAKKLYMDALKNQLDFHEFLFQKYLGFLTNDYKNKLETEPLLSNAEIANVNSSIKPVNMSGKSVSSGEIKMLRFEVERNVGQGNLGEDFFRTPARLRQHEESVKKIASELNLPDGWEPVLEDYENALDEIAKIPGRMERRAAYQGYALNTRPRHFTVKSTDPALNKHDLMFELDPNDASLIPTPDEVRTVLDAFNEFNASISLANLQNIMQGSRVNIRNRSGALKIIIGTHLPVPKIGRFFGRDDLTELIDSCNGITVDDGRLYLNLNTLRNFDIESERVRQAGRYWRNPKNALDKIKTTLQHELGHQVMYAVKRVGTPNGPAVHFNEPNGPRGTYASTNENEHFAESIGRYIGTGEASDRIKKILADNNLIRTGPNQASPDAESVSSKKLVMPEPEEGRSKKTVEASTLFKKIKALKESIANGEELQNYLKSRGREEDPEMAKLLNREYRELKGLEFIEAYRKQTGKDRVSAPYSVFDGTNKIFDSVEPSPDAESAPESRKPNVEDVIAGYKPSEYLEVIRLEEFDEDELSDVLEEAIDEYTSLGFNTFNHYFRYNTEVDEETKAKIDALQEHAMSVTLPEPMSFLRSQLTWGDYDLVQQEDGTYNLEKSTDSGDKEVRSLESIVGEKWESKGFLSTTTETSGRKPFKNRYGRDMKFQIHVLAPKGSHGVTLGLEEREFLMPHGLSYTVIKAEPIDGQAHIWIELDPPASAPKSKPTPDAESSVETPSGRPYELKSRLGTADGYKIPFNWEVDALKGNGPDANILEYGKANAKRRAQLFFAERAIATQNPEEYVVDIRDNLKKQILADPDYPMPPKAVLENALAEVRWNQDRQYTLDNLPESRKYELQNDSIMLLAKTDPEGAAAYLAKENAFVESKLRELTFANGQTVGEVFDGMSQSMLDQIQEIAINNGVSLTMPAGRLKKFIEEDHYRTAFETTLSNKGANRQAYLDARDVFEFDRMGIPYNTKDSERPIYGVIGRTDKEVTYGDTQVIFKDDVKQRTTATIGDSLDGSAAGVSWLEDYADGNVSIDDLWNKQGELLMNTFGNNRRSGDTFSWQIDSSGEEVWGGITGYNGKADIRAIAVYGYIETQIHGGLKLSDVDTIVIPSPTSIPKATQKMLEDRGIKVIIGSQIEKSNNA
jgi:hypothetical protein